MSDHLAGHQGGERTSARDGAITWLLSLLLWGVLLGITLFAGHELANYMAAGHH